MSAPGTSAPGTSAPGTSAPASPRLRTVLIVVGALVLAGFVWVWGAGRVLVRDDGPGTPQVVFSLSGDPLGHRLRAAAKAARATDAERFVVFSQGNDGVYDWHDDALRFLEREGIPEASVRFLGPVGSTADEAALAAGYVERCGWTDVAVTTSAYHTRRAGWLFGRALDDDVTLRVVAADEWFDAGSWWRTEAGREVVLLEWIKGLSSAPYLVSRLDPVASDVPC